MRIKKILSWHHLREFTALFVCEHCGAEQTVNGYDDQGFHQHVIPAMKCTACGKVGSGEDYVPQTHPPVNPTI